MKKKLPLLSAVALLFLSPVAMSAQHVVNKSSNKMLSSFEWSKARALETAPVIYSDVDDNLSIADFGNKSFNYCLNLRSIFLPKNVERIGRECFLGCDALSTVYVSTESLTQLADLSFPDKSGLIIYVPTVEMQKMFNYFFGFTETSVVVGKPAPASISDVNGDPLFSIATSGNVLNVSAAGGSIAIYDMQGHLVRQSNIIDGHYSTTLLSGYYIVRVNNHAETIIIK